MLRPLEFGTGGPRLLRFHSWLYEEKKRPPFPKDAASLLPLFPDFYAGGVGGKSKPTPPPTPPKAQDVAVLICVYSIILNLDKGRLQISRAFVKSRPERP